MKPILVTPVVFDLCTGVNNYMASNVWVDESDLVHLQIINMSGVWTSAELYTTNRFSFGTFQWQVEARLDVLDPNVVLSLYTYEPPVAGVYGTNQINIDFSRWGLNTSVAPNLFYNVWPVSINDTKNGTSLVYRQSSPYTTHRMTWSSTSVLFQSLYGFHNDDTNLFQRWETSASFAPAIPQATAPIHMNLWIFHSDTGDRSPSNGNRVEVIIHDFMYITPLIPSTVSTIEYETWLTILPALYLGVFDYRITD